ncbi:DUF4355 domain-containing protein [Microbacterium sp. LWH11-1.2]|uniref:capsid assembly scaffolding protein Gp46 family protein n=1 Tax=Microbacterium sp. LWH11-1.2 TaxID=3135258 RepID=UPI00313A1730
MSEQTGSTTATEETNEQGTDTTKEFTAITSQEDFDKAIQARIARERAKVPTDYEDLKAAAAELEKIREANKTEAQKAQERLEAAEKRAVELELKATRAEVAAAKSVPIELLSGSTQAELEASADALIAFRGQQASLHVATEGKSSTTSGTTADQFASYLSDKL